jgi:hypothetical protein
MKAGLKLLSAAGVGAGLMYLCDPDRGKRRRALIGNKMKHAARVAGEVLRAPANVEARTPAGLDAEPVIDNQKTIHIEAPVDVGFNCWSPPERISEVISHVHELRCPTLTR